jgi:hypothetical protein
MGETFCLRRDLLPNTAERITDIWIPSRVPWSRHKSAVYRHHRTLPRLNRGSGVHLFGGVQIRTSDLDYSFLTWSNWVKGSCFFAGALARPSCYGSF